MAPVPKDPADDRGARAHRRCSAAATSAAPLVELIAAQGDAIEARTGLRLEVTRVAVRDLAKARGRAASTRRCSPPTPASVVDDPDVDVVVEVIGGIEPPAS